MHDRAGETMGIGKMHTMYEQPVVGGETGQACWCVDVVASLGDVDVHADTEIVGQTGGGLERGVGAGECRVHADMPSSPGAQEALVLGEPGTSAIDTMPISDAVGAVDAHADLRTRLSDQIEAALDGARRLVVVDDRRASRFEGLERAEHGGPADHLRIERDVESPPHELEDREEVGGRARRRRHAARER